MGLFDEEEFGHPLEQSGDFARVEQLAGHLLIVFPIGYIEHHPTRFTQPGKKSDVIVCDLIDLDAADDAGNRGKLYRNAWWRQSQLIIMLRPFVGKHVMGRLGKGVSRNGLNPPWVLNDATQEPGTVELAKQWAAANPNFTKTPFQAPTLPAAPPPQPQSQPQPQYQAPQQPQFQQPRAPQYPPQSAPDPWAQPLPPAPQPTYAPQPPQYQQPVQQYAGPPAFPVDGSAQMPEGMLAMMRAERERREAAAAAAYPQQGQPDNPPF